MHRFGAAFRESREQRRNGSMHFADGEPPMHTVMRHALDTGQRAQEALADLRRPAGSPTANSMTCSAPSEAISSRGVPSAITFP